MFQDQRDSQINQVDLSDAEESPSRSPKKSEQSLNPSSRSLRYEENPYEPNPPIGGHIKKPSFNK